MALLRLYQYDFTVVDELRSGSEEDRQSENIVIEIRDVAGAAPTLYADRYGNTTFTNPQVINTSFKKHTFFSSATSLRYGVYDYGDPADNNHASRIGRYAHGVMGYADPKVIVLPRWGNGLRCIRIPFLATGTDANDLPATWDNAEASAVSVLGGTRTIILPAGFMVNDAIVEVTTIDATETMEVGLLSSETGGDADGFVDAVSLGAAGLIRLSAATRGVLFQYTDADVGVVPHICDGTAKTVTVTGSAGIDTAAGVIWLTGYQLPVIATALYDVV